MMAAPAVLKNRLSTAPGGLQPRNLVPRGSAVPVGQGSGRQRELEIVAERRGRAGPVEQQFADRQTGAHYVPVDQRRDGRWLRRRVEGAGNAGPPAGGSGRRPGLWPRSG